MGGAPPAYMLVDTLPYTGITTGTDIIVTESATILSDFALQLFFSDLKFHTEFPFERF